MGTFAVLTILFVCVIAAIRSIVKQKRMGKSCGGDCSKCMGHCGERNF